MGKRRFDSDWTGSDEWISDTRHELLSRQGHAETLALEYLRRLGVLLRRQELVARRYFVTMVLPDSGIALEFFRSDLDYRGGKASHESERDSHRREAIRRAGWRLVRIDEEEVVSDVRSVLLRISEALGLTPHVIRVDTPQDLS